MTLFWEPETGRKIKAIMPPVPNTGWIRPKELPNLKNERFISIDTETYDPELLEHGPGWARDVGHIVGVSVATVNNAWYFPIRHEVEGSDNFEPDTILSWLRENITQENKFIVGANLTYDIGWLRHENVHIKGKLFDVQYAEALLDESAKVALDILADKYLGEHKVSDDLYRWCADYYGGAVNDRQRANIYRTPPRLTGFYAEADAILPLKLIDILWKLLEEQDLLKVFDMECRLIYMLIDMRFAGVSVDLNKAQRAREALIKKKLEYKAQLQNLVGFEVNVNASASLAKAFDKLGLKYPLTDKGNPSFTKQFISIIEHPIGSIITEIKQCDKTVSTFIDNAIFGSQINGKIYAQFHPLRNDRNGTRSGRFAGTTPNLQQIPSRHDYIGPLIRSIFIPDWGHRQWRRYDYSQIEYRFLVHYAIGVEVLRVILEYCKNPYTDYHKFTQELIKEKTGIVLKRKPVKNVNFGLVYGMGLAKLAKQLNLDKKAANELFSAYHKGAPFVKKTMEATIKEVEKKGYVTTIMGRRSRFDLWTTIEHNMDAVPLPYEKALAFYGEQITPAYTYKALNRRLQGSSADQMKMAMLQCYDKGVFDYTTPPRLTVHDELDFSDPGNCDEAFNEIQRTMETAFTLRIPVKADCEIGKDWGHLEEVF